MMLVRSSVGYWQLCRREAKPRLCMRDCNGVTASPASRRASPRAPTKRLPRHSRMRDGMVQCWQEISRPLWQPRPKLVPPGRCLTVTVQLQYCSLSTLYLLRSQEEAP